MPKRFNAALSESAYAQLRTWAEATGPGNNCVLTVLLENAGEVVDEAALKAAAERLKAQCAD
ncbi:MAG: hypothetical protein ACFB20_09795 [Opitutales bacterium]